MSNNTCCIWIQKVKTPLNERFIFGLSNINIYNGKSNLSEYNELYYHNPTTYDSIEKFINSYNPNETIIIHNLSENIIEGIIKCLQLNSKKNHIIDLNNKTNNNSLQALNCENQVYQNQIIQKYFPNMNNEIFRYNILEKPISLQSYCFLLNFVGLHNVNLINKISEPIIEQLDEILVCANHSLKQLNMIGNGNEINYCLKDGTICSVFSILNKCKTKMGKRAMNEIILNPICNPKKLNEIYNNLDYILDKKYVFDHFLNDIKDYEKILTKIKLNRITPNDIFHIIETHKILENILKYISKDQGHGAADKKLRQMFKFNEYIKSVKNLLFL